MDEDGPGRGNPCCIDTFLVISYFFYENICCGYSLEAPRLGASNEYPQHMVLYRSKQKYKYFSTGKVPYLELWHLLCLKTFMFNLQD